MAPGHAGKSGTAPIEAAGRPFTEPVPIALVGLALAGVAATVATAVLVWLVFTQPLAVVDALNRWLAGS